MFHAIAHIFGGDERRGLLDCLRQIENRRAQVGMTPANLDQKSPCDPPMSSMSRTSGGSGVLRAISFAATTATAALTALVLRPLLGGHRAMEIDRRSRAHVVFGLADEIPFHQLRDHLVVHGFLRTGTSHFRETGASEYRWFCRLNRR